MSGPSPAGGHVVRALLDALGPEARPLGPNGVSLPLRTGLVELVVTDDVPVGPHVVVGGMPVRYRLRGTPDGERAVLRARLIEAFAAADDAIARAAQDERSGPKTPSDLVDVQVAAYAGRARAFPARMPASDTRTPLCLSSDQRPFEERAGHVAASLVPVSLNEANQPSPPCVRCARRGRCPSVIAAGDAQRVRADGIDPLPNADSGSATRAFIEAFSAAFGVQRPSALDAFLACVDSSADADGWATRTPLEVSVKARAGRIERTFRLVDYGPAAADGIRLDATALEARLEVWGGFLRERAPAEARSALASFLALTRTLQPDGPEVSFGVDASATGEANFQAYFHVGHGREVAVLDALRRSPFGVDAARVASSGRITLVACSPRIGAPHRVKLYVDAATRASAVGAFAPFAPPRGLAVWEAHAGTTRFAKFDFPCVVHYQRSRGLEAAFAAELEPSERVAFERIVKRDVVAAWPTWLSVADDGAAFYFVPR